MPITAMTVQFVTTALGECGVPLPAQAQNALDTLTALQAEAGRDVVAEALHAAASTPLTPKTAGKRVQELATALTSRDRAAEAARYYDSAVLEQFRQAIVDNADALVIAMRPYFDAAAQVVHDAGRLIDPNIPPTTASGLDVLEVAQALDDAQRRLTAVKTARLRVAELSGFADADASWFIQSAEDPEALARANSYLKRSWHRLVHAGFTLRLNLPFEAAAVVGNADQGAAAALEASRQARVESARDPLREAIYAQALGAQAGAE